MTIAQADAIDGRIRGNIAANVARLRGERSQYWLAKAVGSNPSHIQRVEDAQHTPGAGLLVRLAEALGVNVQDLLDPPPKKPRRRAGVT